MLSLSLIFHKRAGGCYSSRCSHFRGEDFPHKDKSVCVIRGDQSETAERWFMVYLKGTWSHDEAFNQPTDVYRFVSLLQCSTVYSVTCKVIQRDGYALLDGGERACCCGGFFHLLYIIWSLKTQSSMLKVSDVLVHFMFIGKATPSLQNNNNNNKKKTVWFHNDLCSRNKKEEETLQSRGGICVSHQTEQHKLLLILLLFFF